MRTPTSGRVSWPGSRACSSARSPRARRRAIELRDLLSTGARERVQQLSKLGVSVVVLDECHHLASLWGYVIRAVLGELGDDVHVVGLTPTPPGRAARVRGRALRRAARPGRLHRPDAGRGPRRPARALPGARVADRAGGGRARLPGRARRPLPGADRAAARGRRVPEWVRDALPKRPRLARAGARSPRPTGAPSSSASRPTSRTGCGCSRPTPCASSRRRTRPRRGTRYDEIALALRELGFELTARACRAARPTRTGC